MFSKNVHGPSKEKKYIYFFSFSYRLNGWSQIVNNVSNKNSLDPTYEGVEVDNFFNTLWHYS